MQPATIRRLLVFGVCLVGVGCLYLVPSMAGSSRHVETSREQDPSTAATNMAVGISTTADVAASGRTGLPTEISASATGPSTDGTITGQPVDVRRTSTTPSGATAAVPGRDEDPPAAVGRLTVLSSDSDSVTVSWPAADDDDGVAGYRVLLNGFFVLATQQTRATLTWFNDSNTHVIQVRALDVAGNEGPSSPTLLVTRPVPDPEPAAPAPSSTVSTKPSVSASPTPTEDADETTNTNDAASSASPTQQSGTEEDGS